MTQEQLGKRFYDIPWAVDNSIEATCNKWFMTEDGLVAPLTSEAKSISWRAFGRTLFASYVNNPINELMSHEAD